MGGSHIPGQGPERPGAQALGAVAESQLSQNESNVFNRFQLAHTSSAVSIGA